MQSGRLFRLLYLLLEGENWTVGRLSERLEVSERTIRRDLDALSAAGIPVYTAQGRGGGVGLLSGFVLDRSLLSGQEQDDILSGLQTLHATGLQADDLLCELSGRFGREMANGWIDADFSPWNGGVDREQFDLLREAILHHIPVYFDYCSAEGETTTRTVEPVRLYFKGMAWYMQGWCRLRQDFRTFKLSRMEGVLLCTDETFVPRVLPPEFGQQPAEPATVAAVIRFAPEIAYRVYDEFARARIAPQSDGSLIVHTDWPPGLWGVSYLLSYGSTAEVMEPEALRRAVAQEAQKIAAQYTQKI